MADRDSPESTFELSACGKVVARLAVGIIVARPQATLGGE